MADKVDVLAVVGLDEAFVSQPASHAECSPTLSHVRVERVNVNWSAGMGAATRVVPTWTLVSDHYAIARSMDRFAGRPIDAGSRISGESHRFQTRRDARNALAAILALAGASQ